MGQHPHHLSEQPHGNFIMISKHQSEISEEAPSTRVLGTQIAMGSPRSQFNEKSIKIEARLMRLAS